MKNFLILFTLIGMSCVSSYAYDNYEYTYTDEAAVADVVITVSNGYQSGLAYLNVQATDGFGSRAVAYVNMHENGLLGNPTDWYYLEATHEGSHQGTKALVPIDPYDVTHFTLAARVYYEGFAFSSIYWNDEF